MTFARTAIQDFSTSNGIYANGVVTFYTVDLDTGLKTNILATMYKALTGSDAGSRAANPQTLDSYGKLKQPVYIDVPVIATITGLGNTPDHDTGVIDCAHVIIDATVTWDPGSIADGDGETRSLTVTGAAFGDFVQVSAPYDLQDLQATAYVQASNTVEIRLDNNTGGAVNLGSGSWKVRVTK